jgi:hypothetical protein
LQDAGEIPLSAWEDRNDELYHRWMDITFNLPEPDNIPEKNWLTSRKYTQTQ